MSEETPDKDQESSEQPLAGERLAKARREQDISLLDIAKALHLDEARVQALEQNNFESLGAPVFAKGHLRKYAEIVGVSEDDVIADYFQMNRSVGAPPVVGAPRKATQDIDLTRFVLPVFGLVVVVIILIWWIQSGSPVPSFERSDAVDGSQIELVRPAQTVTPSPSEADVGETESESATETDAPVHDESNTDASAAESAAVAPRVSVPVREPVSGPQVTLSMRFTDDCWTEVTDASGARLFFDLGSEGRTVNVSGTAPLRVLFGSYANVSLSVDGNNFSIPASARRGETARFTINAQ